MQSAKGYIEELRKAIEESSRTRLGQDSINLLNTVSESVFSRSAHFILELLQNAEDAGPKSGPPAGVIEFSLSRSQVRVTHNGLPFTKVNVDAICGVRSSKQPEQGTLGFLGIGFKSVFKVTDCPQIHSGPFHFTFDKSAYPNLAVVPWQIMPLWMDVPKDAISADLTAFTLPFRNAAVFQQTRDELNKLDVHVFLFLKWLRQLKVIDETDGHSIVLDNLGEQGGFLRIKKNETQYRFITVRRTALVPPTIASDPTLVFYKRQNVKQREVIIAFAVDEEGRLQQMEDASALGSVSSFLPLLEERSGAKFLIQADFLVQPGREAIQYELAWNRWLIGEAVEAAKEAIERFKANPRWSRQFLGLFNFNSYPGQPAFDKLFGPELKTPLLTYLQSAEVVATVSGGHAQPHLAVIVEEGLQDLLVDADLSLCFEGETNLRLVDPEVDAESLPTEIRENIRSLDLGQVARNKNLLESRHGQPEWFRKLFEAMAGTHRKFKETQRRGRFGRIEWVADPIYVLTDNGEVLPAQDVHLRSIPKEVLDLRASYAEVDNVLANYKILHASLDTEQLSLFFREYTHVEEIDFDRICRDVFLPKMLTDVAPAAPSELIAYTRLLQMGPRVAETIWVFTSKGVARPSNQVFMGTAYSPAEDWEQNAQFSPQIDFLSHDYLDGVPAADVPGWKKFFTNVGVKESGEPNHVEIFAMSYVEASLAGELSEFVAKHRQQVGYDREAMRKQDGALVKLEVKGRKRHEPVQLVGNESRAAETALKNGEPFWVCIVPGIPEAPQLWVVDDARKAWTADIYKIDVSQWRTHGRRVP